MLSSVLTQRAPFSATVVRAMKTLTLDVKVSGGGQISRGNEEYRGFRGLRGLKKRSSQRYPHLKLLE